MVSVIKNFLPQDTRIVELLSCLSMLGMILLGNINLLFLTEQQTTTTILLTIFGSLQLCSLVLFPKLELIRCLTSWTNGSFFIWLASSNTIDINNISIFLLGISNLYAFIINFNLLRILWVPK